MKENFFYSLEIMGKGMASIFVVIIILTFIVIFLTKLPAVKASIHRIFGRKKDQKQ